MLQIANLIIFEAYKGNIIKYFCSQISDNVEVVRNEYRAYEVNDARSEPSFEDSVKQYLQSHDVTFKLPLGESSVTVGARNLDNGEMNFKLKFSEATGVQEGYSK